ncbi:FAD-dependent oxidoreductase [Agromyces archimandritae]|uniref:FAD-dependent oxidoreductase n=1 Tax=Agromyces archimandritae TaxID=2781962 RepID=A0A975FS12_9MICO|nr:FAD-dependent oxidoreductase [Agromyces archimandritae]
MSEVLVVGAGPAGLAAAVAARERGARVVLLDGADAAGGQYWRHLPPERPAAREARLHHGWAAFERMRGALERDDGCELLFGAHVWAIERDDDGAPVVHALIGDVDGAGRTPRVFRPSALVLATGAHDRTLPFPGWDLPGVTTAGAAQALAKGERIAIGERVVVAGAGPFLLPVAASLAATGARVLGVFEAAGVGALARGWLANPAGLFGAAGKAAELAGYAAGHVRHGIPYRTGRAVVAAHGTDRVEAVTIARVDARWRPIPGTETRVAADAVCVSHGFTPRLELAIAAGCALTPGRFVSADEAQRTSAPGVYAAGEITGIGGADAALAEGRIAGHVAAGGAPGDAALTQARRRRAVMQGFAGRIEAAHGIRPGWTGWLRDDTVVCRCEEVPAARIRATSAATAGAGLRSMKLATRAGLGICQGRVCGRTVEALLAASAPGATPEPPAACGALREVDDADACEPARDADSLEAAGTDRRPIAVPVRLGELAASTGPRNTDPAPPTPERRSTPPEGPHDQQDPRPRRRHRRDDPRVPRGRLGARRPRRRLRPLRRALRLPHRERMPRRRPERLARRVLEPHRRRAPPRRADRRADRRRPRPRRRRRARRRLAPGGAVGRIREGGRRGRRARAAADDLPRQPQRGRRALHAPERGRPADHDVQQPLRHEGRPHARAHRRTRPARERRGRQGVLGRCAPRARDHGTLRHRRHRRRRRPALRIPRRRGDGLVRRLPQRVPEGGRRDLHPRRLRAHRRGPRTVPAPRARVPLGLEDRVRAGHQALHRHRRRQLRRPHPPAARPARPRAGGRRPPRHAGRPRLPGEPVVSAGNGEEDACDRHA